MKRALVLAGGGSKGAYEAGFLKALKELDIQFDIVTGTSIGALNGCLFVQDDIDALMRLWDTMGFDTVFEGDFKDFNFDIDTMIDQSNLVVEFFKSFIKEKGADITPLKQLIRHLLNEEKLLNSSIDFGLCTVEYPKLKPVLISKNQMGKENIYDYLIASASCFPVFPIHTFNETSYIDGGYYDNLPIDLAFDMGADEVVVVDMRLEAIHKHYVNRPNIIYTNPKIDLGRFLDFSRERLDRNQRIGYQMAMKTFHHYVGNKYTFIPFETDLFHKMYKDILYLERYTRTLFKNDSIYNLFLLENGRELDDEKQYLYVILDWFSDLLQRDPSYVYQYDILKQDLLTEFEKFTKEDYKLLSFESADILTQAIKDINNKTLIGRILHGLCHPQEEKIDLENIFKLFSKEVIMAKYLYLIYNEKEQG